MVSYIQPISSQIHPDNDLPVTKTLHAIISPIRSSATDYSSTPTVKQSGEISSGPRGTREQCDEIGCFSVISDGQSSTSAYSLTEREVEKNSRFPFLLVKRHFTATYHSCFYRRLEQDDPQEISDQSHDLPHDSLC